MLRLLTVVLLTLSLCLPARAAPFMLIDAASGDILAEQEAFARWNPASLTKLMTAYVAFREVAAGNLTLKAPVRMSANAASNPPSKMGYAPGAVMTLENALEMLIVKSANDVAVAIGEAVSGSEEAFVERMNAEARILGMTDTNFANPNGLNADNQYTTARDLAILSRAIRRTFPEYDPIFAAEAIRTGETVTTTYNILLGRYDGADGMKTGFVCASGFNLVASATRNGRTLIAVVLGETSQKARAETAARLLDQGFSGTPAIANLTSLQRPAGATTAVADMTGTVCTETARASRWDGRQIEGYINFDVASIKPLTRAPRALPTGLGGAEGASRSAALLNGVYVNAYPIPEQRPERPTLLEEGDADRYGLRPGFNVPVPELRPQNG